MKEAKNITPMVEVEPVNPANFNVEKSLEQLVFDVKMELRKILNDSGLNITVLELITHELYYEVESIYKAELENKLKDYNVRVAKEIMTKSKEEVNNGNPNAKG